MPSNSRNRGGNRSRSKNNNPEGYNQYNRGWIDSARDRPVAAAAAAAAAVGAGVFLWSRRSQISEQLNNLSDQIGEWSESMTARADDDQFEMAGGESSFGASSGAQFSGSGTTGIGTTSLGGTTTATGKTAGSTSAKRGGNKSGRTPT